MKRFVSGSLLGLLGALLATSCSRAQFPAAPGTGPGLAETVEAIDSARVTTRILYITAHPDDESAAVLTYLARGLHADVALLSLTRGEGGQNALGPEQAPQLGLIRTQELLAATRGYGVKLYFTRARDFGFSKTPEESERVWGDQVLVDMIRVLREFRPNIVINGWGGVHSGHGHHQAAGILTPKAVQLAADANASPELAKEGLYAWAGGREPVQILDLDRSSENPRGYVLPVDELSPLYNKSYRQMGIDAFVNHRTQGMSGFINSPFLRRPLALTREDGQALVASSLAQPFTELFRSGRDQLCDGHKEWCDGLLSLDKKLTQARLAALASDYSAATDLLCQAQKQLAAILPPDVGVAPGNSGPEYLAVTTELARITRALELVAGFVFEAEADRSDVVVGEPLSLRVTYHCRPGVQCPFAGPLEVRAGKPFAPLSGDPVHGEKFEITLDAAPAEPPVSEQLDGGYTPRLISVSIQEKIDSQHEISVPTEVFYIFASSTSVGRIPVRIVPAYTLAVDPQQTVEVLDAKHKPFAVLLRVHSYSTRAGLVSAGLEVPDGLRASAPVELHFSGIGDQYAKLTVTPLAKMAARNYTITAYAKRGEEKFSTSIEPLPSMPAISWSEPAQTVVHAFGIQVPGNLRVGYISAESEPVPEALKRLGIVTDLLDANALNFGELGKYHAIVVGVRAYELRPELAGANKRLLEYVSEGGTLVVQYNRDTAWDKLQPAPYPARIGTPTPRITDEHSPVKFLLPDDPLLNQPNKITQADFEGWVQERGLYFWSEFDPRYTAVLAMNDPGEAELHGGLVYTRYGKGVYIYTGLAFFRELPEGVPGAYRLFVNLLCARESIGSSK